MGFPQNIIKLFSDVLVKPLVNIFSSFLQNHVTSEKERSLHRALQTEPSELVQWKHSSALLRSVGLLSASAYRLMPICDSIDANLWLHWCPYPIHWNSAFIPSSMTWPKSGTPSSGSEILGKSYDLHESQTWGKCYFCTLHSKCTFGGSTWNRVPEKGGCLDIGPISCEGKVPQMATMLSWGEMGFPCFSGAVDGYVLSGDRAGLS